MHLVHILLPLYDNAGEPYPRSLYRAVRDELTERFGGLTAYSRAPAEGFWKEEQEASTNRDDIIIYEVMVDELDRVWWQDYRKGLETRLAQEQVVVRAQEVTLM